ncbi:MAG TPA: cell division ATP-binding protein FtsE [Gammaproteobacteria bacterium]|nr:cell division ATP-binding protein FtsE [Gammaproteobacteria bacterium]
MIHLQHISKRYANNHLALDNVSFDLERGELAFLTGHSGAGKSTLLKLIAAMESPSNGQIKVANHHLNRLKPRHIPFFRRHIGIILQSPHLLMDRSVLDNAALPLIIAGRPYRDIQNRARAVLSKMGLHHKQKCFPCELSSGEQQRVAIARAVINKPSILLADEPTGNLDPKLAQETMELFQQFNELGMTMLIASHDLALIHQLKHRVITLSEGKLA